MATPRIRPIPALPEPPALPAPAQVIDVDFEEAHVPLAHYLWILRRHLWKILAFVAASVLATLIVSYRLTPVYESTATIDIDRNMPTDIVGQDTRQIINNDADQFLATQVKMIQSDSVLRPVVSRFKLLDRPEEKSSLDEKDPAQNDPDSPILLKRLKVTRSPNTYLIHIAYRSYDRKLAADVANAIGQSYLEHTYNIRYKAAAGLSHFMEKQLEELRAKMERSSGALASYEKELNIINPEERTNILSARLLELNSEYTKAQADRVQKEAAHRSTQSGNADAAHVSSQSEALEKLTEQVNAARQRFAEIKTHYGSSHPEYLTAAAQLSEVETQFAGTASSIRNRVQIEYTQSLERETMIERAVQQSKDEFDSLNARSFEYQNLKREAEGDKKLYEELLRRIKEATINASFQNHSARIADPARPGRKPVFPNKPLNLILALLASSLLAVGIAVLSDVLDDTVRDPEQVARSLGTQVVGSLPEVRPWRNQLPTIIQNGSSNGVALTKTKYGANSLSTYEEAIRTLRNSILLTDFDRRLKTMLVTSASPSEGKSTIAIHLAVAHAQQHHRTLVIDGDLRRPSVHKRFNLRNTHGLSDILVNADSWRPAVVAAPGIPNLDIIPAGSASPRRAADLLGKRLESILDEVADDYDLIIVDAPPLLGFPEPLQMAASVDGVVVVARAGQTSRRAVASVIHTLERLRAPVIGVVLNEVTRQMSHSYYYYGYYKKYYHDPETLQ